MLYPLRSLSVCYTTSEEKNVQIYAVHFRYLRFLSYSMHSTIQYIVLHLLSSNINYLMISAASTDILFLISPAY